MMLRSVRQYQALWNHIAGFYGYTKGAILYVPVNAYVTKAAWHDALRMRQMQNARLYENFVLISDSDTENIS